MNSGIIFLSRISGSANRKIIYFRLYFRSLYEQKCFDVDLPRKYYYPQDLLIDKYGFWEELEAWRSRLGYKIFLSTKCTNEINFVEIKSIEEFYKGDFL